MKRGFVFLGLMILAPLLAFISTEENISEVSLMEFRAGLGDAIPGHYISNPAESEVEIGRQLIHEGRAYLPEGKSDYISKFYVCTSCHNTVREDPDLRVVDSEARLEYAIAGNIPYLQASTFWGIVNRNSWYNDDYVKKYGDLVVEANKSLEGSIQLCAQECSQGRELEDWEMQAILAYFSSLEVMLADLDFSVDELKVINNPEESNVAKLTILNQHYMARSPATFLEQPQDKKLGYGLEGRPGKGKAIYELSCQHCHKEDGVSDLVLDDSKKTFRWLRKNIRSNSRYSLYDIVRHGTFAEYGHREYMPLYTEEKMSNQQVEDLRSYIEQMAN